MKTILLALAATALVCVSAHGQGAQNVRGIYGFGPPSTSLCIGDVGSRYIDQSTNPPTEYITTLVNLNSPPAGGSSNGTGVQSCTWTAAGGGANPSGNAGDVQTRNGSNLAAGHINDNGTVVAVTEDTQFAGPNPGVDIRVSKARPVVATAVPNVAGITYTSSSSSPNITISAASTLQNGDWVALVNGGSLNANTPPSPTVTPSLAASQTNTLLDVNGPSGSTQYCYQIVSVTFLGGYAPGSEVCTNTGQASLGLQTVNITSVSVGSNNLATFVTSSQTLAVGAKVIVSGVVTVDYQGTLTNPFNGDFTVNTVPDSTHFTVYLPYDTRNGSITSGTGGTISYWNSNHIVATETTNNYQYAVYGRVTGGSKTLIGMMLPQDHSLLSDATYLVFDDFGSTVTTFPSVPFYLPSTVPSSTQNDMFGAQIVSGAGTTSLTLSANVTNGTSGQTIVRDDAQAFLAAANLATATGSSTAGPVVIPATGNSSTAFVFNFPISLPGSSGWSLGVEQLGNIYVNAPITATHGALHWHGLPGNGTKISFSQQFFPSINCKSASPCISSTGGAGDVAFNSVNFVVADSTVNGMTLFMQDNGSIPTSKFSDVGFSLASGGVAYSNMAAVFRGNGNDYKFSNTTLTSRQNGNFTDSTPGIYFNGSVNADFDNLFLSAVGIGIRLTSGSGSYLTAKTVYCQACYMADFTVENSGGGIGVTMKISNVIIDTATYNPIVSNPSGGLLTLDMDTGGTLGITGAGNNTAGWSAQNNVNSGTSLSATVRNPAFPVGYEDRNDTFSVRDGTFGPIARFPMNIYDKSISIGQGYSVFTTTGPYAAPTCTLASGGSLSTGNHWFYYAPIFADGGDGTASQSCVINVTSGNQTVNVTIPSAVAGVTQYDVFTSTTSQDTGAIYCTAETGLGPFSFSGSGAGCSGGSGYLGAGASGPSGMRNGKVWDQTNQIGLSSITSNATASRAVTLPDTAGSVAIGGTITAAPILGYYLSSNCSTSNLGNCFYTPADTQESTDCAYTTSSTTVTCLSHFGPVTAASSGGTVVYTFEATGPDGNGTLVSPPSNWANGDSIIITGFAGGNTGFNITCTITALTSNSVSCALAGSASSGQCSIGGGCGYVQNQGKGPFLPTDCNGGTGCTGTSPSKRIFGFQNGGAFINTNAGSNANLPLTNGTAVSISGYTSSTQVTISTAAGSTTTGKTAVIVWGHTDDAGALAADTAMATAANCPHMTFVNGNYLFTVPHFVTQPIACAVQPPCLFAGTAGCNNAGNMLYAAGFSIEGRDTGTTTIFMPNGFPETGSCGNGKSGAACWVVSTQGRMKNLQFTGVGDYKGNNIAGSTIVLEVDGPASLDNITLTNFAVVTSGGTDASTHCVGAFLWAQLTQVNISGCGASGLTTNVSSSVTAIRLSVDNTDYAGLNIGLLSDFYVQSVAQFDQYNLICYDCRVFGGTGLHGSSFALVRNNGLKAKFYHSTFSPYDDTATSTKEGLDCVSNGCVFDIEDTFVDMTGAGGGFGSNGNAIHCYNTCTVKAKNSLIKGQSGGNAYVDVSGSVFVDQCGNTLGSFSLSGSILNSGCSANTGTPVTAAKLVLSANWGTGAAVSSVSGGNSPIGFTITNGSTSTGASPTIAYTFPTAYPVSPLSCTAVQAGGTNATGTFTSSSLSATGVTFTYSLTPTASDTEIIQVTCVNP